MTQDEEAFLVLLKQLGEGSQEAGRVLVERFGPHILRAVRQRIHGKLRPKFDSLDFVQDVWASFFLNDHRKERFQTSEDLIRFLTRVAQNKVTDQVRKRLSTQRFNVNKEASLDAIMEIAPSLFAKKQRPTPSEVFSNQEELDLVLRPLPLVHRKIVLMCRDGLTHQEIAKELGISEKTVQRVVAKISKSENQ